MFSKTKTIFYFVVLLIHETSTYKVIMKPCEKTLGLKCAKVLTEAFAKGSEDKNPMKAFCLAQQGWVNCVSSDESRTCKGIYIDDLRTGVAVHNLVNFKTKICPEMNLDKLLAIVRADVTDTELIEGMSKVETDQVEECAVTINKDCVTAYAINLRQNFKDKACISDSINAILKCFEIGQISCRSKLLLDNLNVLEKYSRLMMDSEVFANCKAKVK